MTAPAPRLPGALPGAGLAAVILLVLGAGLARLHGGPDPLDQLGWLPACPLRSLAGLPCPGCGMTRALLLLGQLRVGEALALHPLAPGLLAAAVWGAMGAPGRARVSRDVAAAVLLALVLAVWLLRLYLGALPPA